MEMKRAPAKIKVTKKYLTDWINKQLPKYTDGLVLQKIQAVNTNANPVMGFVVKIVYHFDSKGYPIFVYSFFTMKEMTEHLNAGYELEWTLRDGKWFSESEIGLKKIIQEDSK